MLTWQFSNNKLFLNRIEVMWFEDSIEYYYLTFFCQMDLYRY